MARTLKYFYLTWLRYDLAAGFSVFLVALPLCLGIALASGAPLYAGLLSGIIGGMVVASISGSQLAVSGPAAGLTTLVAASIISLGDYRLFLLTVIIAGLFQLLLGILKLGSIANYFPSAVIKGMLAAIGIILISKQIPLALGYDKPDFWTSAFPDLFSFHNFLGNILIFSGHIDTGPLLITLFTLITMVLIQKKVWKISHRIPASLAAVTVGILLNFSFVFFYPPFASKSTQLVNIPNDIFSNILFPDLSLLFSSTQIWKHGIVLGLLASLETLLCVEAMDKLDKHNRITPLNRELMAQGAGNMVCGLLGAIPLTAVIVRGAANVDAGGKTKFSAITHGFLLFLAVILFPFALNNIPFASLAGILLVTGYNLTKPKLYKEMWQLGLKQFLPFIITIFVILASDLLVGVSIGLMISIYFIVQNNFKAEYKITKVIENGKESGLIVLNSNVTFLNKVNLKKVLEEIPGHSILTIDGRNCNFIDYDILEVISEFQSKANDRHIELHLLGIERVDVSAIH